jgi:hypothetical protein
MPNLTKDIFIGFLLVTGVWSFISGVFVVSTMVFAGAALLSNISSSLPLIEEQE